MYLNVNSLFFLFVFFPFFFLKFIYTSNFRIASLTDLLERIRDDDSGRKFKLCFPHQPRGSRFVVYTYSKGVGFELEILKLSILHDNYEVVDLTGMSSQLRLHAKIDEFFKGKNLFFFYVSVL